MQQLLNLKVLLNNKNDSQHSVRRSTTTKTFENLVNKSIAQFRKLVDIIYNIYSPNFATIFEHKDVVEQQQQQRQQEEEQQQEEQRQQEQEQEQESTSSRLPLETQCETVDNDKEKEEVDTVDNTAIALLPGDNTRKSIGVKRRQSDTDDNDIDEDSSNPAKKAKLAAGSNVHNTNSILTELCDVLKRESAEFQRKLLTFLQCKFVDVSL